MVDQDGENSENNEEVGAFTEDSLQAMRKAGMPKPKEVTWSQWLGPKKLNSRHHLICYFAAIGLRNTDIAKQVGLSQSTVNRLLANPKIKNEIQYLQRQLFGEDPRRRFSSLLSDTIDVQEEVMKNIEEKGSTRLMAASAIQDRALGKAPQQIEIGGNLIRALFEKMDQKRREPEILDVTPQDREDRFLPSAENSEDNDKEEVEAISIKEEEPVSSIDEWVKNNLGENK